MRDIVIDCAGMHVDFGARTISALGRLLPVTCVSYSEASPERPGTDRVATPENRLLTELIYKTPERIEAAIRRPILAMPESLHFNVLCENGWWVEVALYPEEGVLSYLPARGKYHDERDGDAADLLAFYEEVSRRPTYVPSSDPDSFDEPWGGLAPGSWDLVG